MSNILEQQDIRALGSNLELLARQVVEGFIVGMHRSPFHGFSVEFAEHRLYNTGESTRNIDWKVYARTDKLFVKRFEEETNLRCQIVVDCSSTMYYPWDERNPQKLKYKNKLCFAAQSAAALMYALRKQRDAFGLTLFDDQIRVNTNCKSTTQHYQQLLAYLVERIENPQLNRPTDLSGILHAVADAIHRRSLVIIFTDVLERPEEADKLFSALQHLRHNKHEVILFHVTDKTKELDFEFENRPYLFVDMETGTRLTTEPWEIAKRYRDKLEAWRAHYARTCREARVDYVPLDTRTSFDRALMAYLEKRAKLL